MYCCKAVLAAVLIHRGKAQKKHGKMWVNECQGSSWVFSSLAFWLPLKNKTKQKRWPNSDDMVILIQTKTASKFLVIVLAAMNGGPVSGLPCSLLAPKENCSE